MKNLEKSIKQILNDNNYQTSIFKRLTINIKELMQQLDRANIKNLTTYKKARSTMLEVIFKNPGGCKVTCRLGTIEKGVISFSNFFQSE